MRNLKKFKSTDLLTVLVALLELQIFAVEAKRTCVAKAAVKYFPECLPALGICFNMWRVPSEPSRTLEPILDGVMLNAPSNLSKSLRYPVNPPDSIDWKGYCRTSMFEHAAPFTMWGDHPYADNRRQLISEMIAQLQVELWARGYAV